MRHALLRGRDHVEIGAVAAESEGAVAAALSRGGALKRYPHQEANEDAALFATGPGGALLAVADAHDGEVAASATLEHLLRQLASRWTEASPLCAEAWEPSALAALLELNDVVRRAAAASDTPRSCTTLSLAVIRPEEQLVLHANVGDSHLFQVGEDTVTDRGVRSSSRTRRSLGSYFLGFGEETLDSLASKSRIGSDPLTGTRAIVLATDGISERNIGLADPEATVARCVREASEASADLRPLCLARSVVERALEAHARNGSGDNVAVVSLWLAP